MKRESGLLALIILLIAIVSAVDASFLSWQNTRDILVRFAPVAIVACGVTLVVLTGEIDISVGSLMALLATCLGIALSAERWDWSPWIGLPTIALLGAAFGALTGALVAIGRVPSIVATLGTLTALRGVSTLAMNGRNIDGLPEALTTAAKEGPFGLPLSVWVAAIVLGMTWFLMRRTPLGLRLYALGSQPDSARTIGLSATRLKIFVFAYTGLLTAIATIVDVPRLPKIESGIGVGFELTVVTCVVVGGVSISGGRGGLLGVALATLLITLIRPGLTFLDIGDAGEKWARAIQGGLILLAVVADRLGGRPSRKEAS